MKRLSFFMIIIILFSLGTQIIQASSQNKTKIRTLYIDNVDDLKRLSKDCSYDNYSREIKVVLNRDIDLGGEPFTPIPIFLGVFDGGGHKIKGLSIDVEGSNQGLFRYLEKGGIIKDLKVEGLIKPTGEKSIIGGIVGYNKGTIENSSFSGDIKGKDIVGGIAGWNGNTGIIINSTAKGTIYGTRKVGGIAGYNTGTILRCSNELDVNTTVEEYRFDYEDIDIQDVDIAKLSRLSGNITDIGGIAGFNSGIIKNSRNDGSVGYPHVGYNVGGIAGRQIGYITESSNYGTIHGRKEVGGIVGQMEPYINIIVPPSKLSILHQELNSLKAIIAEMVGDVRYTSKGMEQKLSKIQEDIEKGKGYARDLANMTENLVEDISLIGLEVIDRLAPIREALGSLIKDLEEVLILAEKSLDHIIIVLEGLSQYSNEYEEISANIESIFAQIREATDKMSQFNARIREALDILLEGKTEGVLEILGLAAEDLDSALDLISQTTEDFEAISAKINELISLMDGDLGEDLGAALGYMGEAMQILIGSFDEIEVIRESIKDVLSYLEEAPIPDFEIIRGDYQRAREGLYDAIGDVSSSLSELMDYLSLRGKVMMEGMEKATDQLLLIMDIMFGLIEDLMKEEIGLDKIYKDVSKEDIENKTQGKVSYCKNFGAVEGDINVGGIAGAMAIELEIDPEDDYNIMKDASINAVFQTSAIIQNSENWGDIIAKKNSVGGITGSMDLGYIIGCIAGASVESIDGNYVGGIAGRAYGAIASSYAKALLKGRDYIGGIAGLGKEIKDSYTLVKIARSKACVGAIAGDVDKDGIIKDNYFVSKNLAGIDGISYGGKAEPIGYETLISKENIPDLFRKFKISFMAEDDVIYTLNLTYGDPVSLIDIPNIPDKKGYYGKWEEFGEDKISFDMLIKALYTPYLTVIESKEKRDNTLPIVLVEGEFTQEDSLSLIYDEKIESPKLEKGTGLELIQLIIPGDENTEHILRYLPPKKGKNLRVYIKGEGNWRRVKSSFDGKYLVFEGKGSIITFYVVDMGVPYGKYIALGGVAFLAIILIILLKNRVWTIKRAA